MSIKVKMLGSLQIEPEAKRLNTRFLVIQKISFLLMGLILVGALFGFFGPGLLGASTIHDGDLEVSYDKYIRVQATTMIRIRLNTLSPSSTNHPYRQIWISQSLFQKVSMKSLNPQPFVQQIFGDKILLSFPQRDNADHIELILIVEPERIGFLRSEIGLLSGETVRLKQFIYP